MNTQHEIQLIGGPFDGQKMVLLELTQTVTFLPTLNKLDGYDPNTRFNSSSLAYTLHEDGNYHFDQVEQS